MLLAALPVTGDAALILAVAFGAVFGALLHRGGVADYNVIVNQFRLRDWTVLKVMLTAILVGGIGVAVLRGMGLAQHHIKPANMLAVPLGSAIFGVGMVLYGYCPGTGIAAIGRGSLDALIGLAGMLAGGILYALSFGWLSKHVLGVAALGKVRLPEITGVPEWGWLLAIGAAWALMVVLLERRPATVMSSETDRVRRPEAPTL